MEITEVKVFPINEEKLKAFVSIVFDQCFMVNDIKIIQGRDGLFISMPSRKKKNGEFKDVAHPLNNETRRMIEDKVLAEYERALAERPLQAPAAGGDGAPGAPERARRGRPRDGAAAGVAPGEDAGRGRGDASARLFLDRVRPPTPRGAPPESGRGTGPAAARVGWLNWGVAKR